MKEFFEAISVQWYTKTLFDKMISYEKNVFYLTIVLEYMLAILLKFENYTYLHSCIF